MVCRVQREQIMAKQQEMENARLKNSGRAPKGSKDGLRPESPQSRKPRRPPVRKMVQTGKARFEVHDKYELLFLFVQTFHQYYEMQGVILRLSGIPYRGVGVVIILTTGLGSVWVGYLAPIPIRHLV